MRHLIGMVLLTLASLANAQASLNYSDWSVRPSDGMIEAATSNEAGHQLGMICSTASRQCTIYLQGGARCEQGTRYTVLAASEQAGFQLELACVATSRGDNYYVFTDFRAVAEQLRAASNLTVAIVTRGGGAQTMRFSLSGFNASESAIGDLTHFAYRGNTRRGLLVL